MNNKHRVDERLVYSSPGRTRQDAPAKHTPRSERVISTPRRGNRKASFSRRGGIDDSDGASEVLPGKPRSGTDSPRMFESTSQVQPRRQSHPGAQYTSITEAEVPSKPKRHGRPEAELPRIPGVASYQVSSEPQSRPGAVYIPGDVPEEEGTVQWSTEDESVLPVPAEVVDVEEENVMLREQCQILRERNELQQREEENRIRAMRQENLMLRERDEIRQTSETAVVGQVVAEPQDDGGGDAQGSPRWQLWLKLASAVMAVLVPVIVLTVVLVQRLGPDSEQPTPVVTPTPTPFPTSPATPTSPSLSLIGLISTVTSNETLQDPSTPQYSAFNWLADNVNLDTYSDAKKLQRYALAAFYYSTGGDNWDQNDKWLDQHEECGRWWQWQSALYCTTAGAIIRLDMDENNLVGSIPPEISVFANSLMEFDLENNGLTGSIPSAVGDLTRLVVLALDRNSLSGTVPTVLGRLTSLEALVLWDNGLTGLIPTEIGSLTKLTLLSLGTNPLQATIPTIIGHLTNLLALGLFENSLTGFIPSEIGMLTKLTALGLHSNQLQGTIPTEMYLLTNLNELYLNGNMLTGSFVCPGWIESCAISCDDGYNDVCRSL